MFTFSMFVLCRFCCRDVNGQELFGGTISIRSINSAMMVIFAFCREQLTSLGLATDFFVYFRDSLRAIESDQGHQRQRP